LAGEEGWGTASPVPQYHQPQTTLQVLINADMPAAARRQGASVVRARRGRHGVRNTTAMASTVAGLVAGFAASALARLLRIGWRALVDLIEQIAF
jgi:hypothetical protein